MRAFACLLAIASVASADDVTRKMTARLSEEAEAFVKIAPNVVGSERLHQNAIKPPGRFHPRIGAAATAPVKPDWVEREIVSEYTFAVFGGEAGAIHELRQVLTVDGKKVSDTNKAQEALAKAITASDDAQKKQMLKDFEKYGLTGAVTDFGQLILLFSRRQIDRYEFTLKGALMIGYERALVFRYKQLDGPEALTLFEENKNEQVRHMRIEGEIRVRAADMTPLQITLIAQQGDVPSSVREEAAVTYMMSKFGALLPVSTDHRELRGGKVVAENRFSYTDFHKFGASAEIKFEAGK